MPEDIVVFRRRLVKEHGDFLKKMSSAQKAQGVFVWGGEEWTPQKIQTELEKDTSPLAESYTKMMYYAHQAHTL